MGTLNWSYSVTSNGPTGTFVVTSADTPAGGPYAATGVSGSWNGHAITAVNNYDGGDNLLSTAAGYAHGFNGNGISFATSAGNFNLWNNGSSPRLTSTASGVAGTAIPIINSFSEIAACYLQGTSIETDRGPVAVESLRIGDRIVSAFGGTVLVRWIGHTRLDARKHSRPWDVNPVLIRAGAFGERLPWRDLRLSPDHPVYVDGVLILIRHLINDGTVVQESAGRITYWHVELGQHDVILAEGLPAESYLDTGNRAAFDNGSVTALRPEFQLRDRAAWDALACAALHEMGPLVETVRARLNARALELGWPVATGFEVRIIGPGTSQVSIPPGVDRVHLLSDCVTRADDGRRMGAAISAVALDGEATPLDGAMLASGFHAVEHSGMGSWRWTNGMGVLSFPASSRARLLTTGVVMLSRVEGAIAA